MAYLDHREKGGYTTHEVTFHPQTKGVSSFTVLVYIGTELNPNYLGPAPLDAIAKQVVNSRGPSGCNTEYMLNLATSMREIAPLVSDEHLYSLESKVREMIWTKLRTRSGRVTTLPEHCLCNCCDSTAVAKETKQVSWTQDKEKNWNQIHDCGQISDILNRIFHKSNSINYNKLCSSFPLHYLCDFSTVFKASLEMMWLWSHDKGEPEMRLLKLSRDP